MATTPILLAHSDFIWFIGRWLGGLFLWFMYLSEILLFIVFGAIYGFIPALITGFAAMLLKSERDVLGIMTTVGIGFLVSLIYSGIVSNNSLFSGTMAVAGGLSALILSFVVLPKPNSSNN